MGRHCRLLRSAGRQSVGHRPSYQYASGPEPEVAAREQESRDHKSPAAGGNDEVHDPKPETAAKKQQANYPESAVLAKNEGANNSRDQLIGQILPVTAGDGVCNSRSKTTAGEDYTVMDDEVINCNSEDSTRFQEHEIDLEHLIDKSDREDFSSGESTDYDDEDAIRNQETRRKKGSNI